VNVGGIGPRRFEISNGQSQKSISTDIKMEAIPNYDDIKEKDNPLETVVNKIEETGRTLEVLFHELDLDNDHVLTLKEIETGIKK
jgi:hypothetical protein